MEELLVSSLAQTDALAKLLIDKRLITREEFMQKVQGIGKLSDGVHRGKFYHVFQS